MLRPVATIWEARIQVVCGAVSARDGAETELWMCANFGQTTIDPPRIVVNPNRVYPIEGAVLREGRFALNVFAPEARDATMRLMAVPRRTPQKARIAGFTTILDPTHGIPYLEESIRTLFCAVEDALNTGDHTVIIARVLEDRGDAPARLRLPLLYPEVTATPTRYPRARNAARALLENTGAAELIRLALSRRRGASRPNLAANTYDAGGYTDAEIDRIGAFGMSDRGRRIAPPSAMPPAPRRRVGICLVGVGQWGSFLATQFSRDPAVELYVSGRDAARTKHLADRVGAAGVIADLQRAIADPRVEAIALALPHSMHRDAALQALGAGKHVMVEKPIALTLADADDMHNAATAAGRILMVAENFHFRPAVRVALEAMERGDIGEPQYLRAHGGGLHQLASGWKTRIDTMGGGIVMDLGIHYVRALRLLLGEPDAVLAAHGMQINTRMAGEDSAQLLFRSRFGWHAQMLLNWSGPRGDTPDIEVFGTRGTLSLYSARRYVECSTAERPAYLAYAHYIRPAWLAQRLTRPSRFIRRIAIPDADVEGYCAEIREFVTAIVDERAVHSDAAEGRRDLEVVLAAYDSLRRDAWVDIAAVKAAADPH